MLKKVPILTRGGTICLKYYGLTLKTVWIIEEKRKNDNCIIEKGTNVVRKHPLRTHQAVRHEVVIRAVITLIFDGYHHRCCSVNQRL